MTMKRRLAQESLRILPGLLAERSGGGFAGSPDVPASALDPRIVYSLHAGYRVECETSGLGRAKVIALPDEETERRWKETTCQWPIMHAVTYGVSRDQMMARHKANHIQVVYAHSAKEADLALYTKAALAAELGLDVSLCGTTADGKPF